MFSIFGGGGGRRPTRAGVVGFAHNNPRSLIWSAAPNEIPCPPEPRGPSAHLDSKTIFLICYAGSRLTDDIK